MKQVKKNRITRILCNVLALSFAVCCCFVLTISAQEPKPQRPATLAAPSGVKFRTLGKMHMTITVLETRNNYRPRITREQFVESVLSTLRDRKVPNAFKDYLGVVFAYHQRNLTADQVYDTESGEAYVKLNNALLPQVLSFYRKGMSAEDIGNLLMPPSQATTSDAIKRKINWKQVVNCVRKALDAFDDYLQAT